MWILEILKPDLSNEFTTFSLRRRTGDQLESWRPGSKPGRQCASRGLFTHSCVPKTVDVEPIAVGDTGGTIRHSSLCDGPGASVTPFSIIWRFLAI
ncbi:hypothetical protein HNY73_009839 [Argiope bruennichi]|uniref:Uncharacterized protein n=1 Tax=Argiope bruennichi TaxID=94029 RepID=A0A8T0FHI1_ARGBR|nr:hypothetical protein HNY73_009839 [Argiope bruennichi]